MRKTVAFLSLNTFYLILTTPVHAVCPVCTVAVGAGLGLARYLGVDDTVSGVWVGGLILSSSFWLSSWAQKRKLLPSLNSYLSLLSVVFMFLIVLLPLWFSKIIGHPFNTIYGVDKLVFGTIVGSLVFLLGMNLDKQVRKAAGHQFFLYQKVVFPVAALALGSLAMYLLSK